ncbi:phage portal protein [Bacillus idriensis]|uniref:Phage portal protein n=1 Tax=Metabacillus idriensis TaxID=324768 RepID=A0A6I2MGB0_9BACI|nr:phage portal protein [Metabacillus idriensis]MRX54833.1 phage portal protein [Metabacillus idriensis]
MRKFKKQIDENGIDETLISEILTAHSEDHKRMKGLYERYKADVDGPKIFMRSAVAYDGFGEAKDILRLDDKVDNRLNNAFDADIVDTKIGYMFGHPISYDVDKSNESLKQVIEEFLIRNNTEDADSELGKMAAICGRASRLLYLDTEGKECIKNLDPWETVFIGEDIHEPAYSLWAYKVGDMQHVEFYDDSDVYVFVNGEFVDVYPHLFDHNPLYGVANNKEMKADAEKVLALIDAYDRTLSDASNEIEQYRLAYLLLKGMGADEDTLKDVKKSGIFELIDESDDVKYLTKDINDGMIENHLNRLEENILRFAKSVNFSDESFSGTITGVAMRFKLLALENKCITMERKFNAALRYQFKVLFSTWSKRKGFNSDDYLQVWFGWKRNLPANLLDEAQTTAAFKGHISERTRLSMLTQVDDVEYELKEMQKDAVLYGNRLEPLDTDLEHFGNEKNNSEADANENDDTHPCNVCGGSGKVSSPKTGNQIQCTTCKGTGVRKS